MSEVRSLSKTYRVHRRPLGLAATLRSLFRRTYEPVRALSEVSFDIGAGERVGFLGPNGAGKMTTLQILSGLLHSTSGRAVVARHVPSERAPDFLSTITLVMGQKQQLTLVELLDIGASVGKPMRQLSLGQRMKCKLVAALLHQPRALFLDAPTIGLDVAMQARMRQFIREYNERTRATVLLTSHYMEDALLGRPLSAALLSPSAPVRHHSKGSYPSYTLFTGPGGGANQWRRRGKENPVLRHRD